jgi:deazaflavin-dependent oxidoreductase (nitroreductase family)
MAITTVDPGRDRALGARRAFFGPLTRILNPLIRRMAGRAGVPLIGLVRHRGRRSGTTYLAPVAVGATETVFLIPLTFGSESDWCRNIVAAGGCEVKLRGVEYLAVGPHVVDDLSVVSEIDAAFNVALRFALRAQGIHQYLRLHKLTAEL